MNTLERLKALKDAGITIEVIKSTTPMNHAVGCAGSKHQYYTMPMSHYILSIYIDTSQEKLEKSITHAEGYLIDRSEYKQVPDHLEDVFNEFYQGE